MNQATVGECSFVPAAKCWSAGQLLCRLLDRWADAGAIQAPARLTVCGSQTSSKLASKEAYNHAAAMQTRALVLKLKHATGLSSRVLCVWLQQHCRQFPTSALPTIAAAARHAQQCLSTLS